MTDLTPNIPLLRKAVEWAEAEAAKPDEQCAWWQGTYEISAVSLGRECGTCYCIAGYVWRIAGDGKLFDYDEDAARLLGIDVAQHNYRRGLFAADNTIEDVRRIAEGIAAKAGERL
jgi:hypothetical protein